MAVFFVALVLGESSLYALTGRAISTWALVLAALAAALLFTPFVQLLQRLLDRTFFRQHIDTLAAMRRLGAGDLAKLPHEDVEPALLARICEVSYRLAAALDERGRGGGVHVYPPDAPVPQPTASQSLRLDQADAYELCLPLPGAHGAAYLYLGAHADGRTSDEDEIDALQHLARFAAMSLEHARLLRRQGEEARLDSLARVAAQLHSHDLKNRLNDLAFLAHNLQAGNMSTAETARLIGAIRKVVARMQTVMQRLADPNAPITPRLAPVDARSLIESAVAQWLWPEGVRVKLELEAMPPLAADAAMLKGVLGNIFDNAVQAMQRQGDLTVRARRHGNRALIQISDNGCGMSEAFMHERLFHLFATNKANGLGIGLYLCRRIIHAHHGRITAVSPGEGKGSTFSIDLPLWHAGGEGIEHAAHASHR